MAMLLIHELSGVVLDLDANHLVGRGWGADITLDDPSVSQRHASLEVIGRYLIIQDHDSTNGTYINDRRVSRRGVATPGDTVRFGKGTSAFLVATSADTCG
jgi:pSer/pThr/pTyr-binding forkhead associated (FHA) protein